MFSACGNGKKGVFTPTSSGRAYEILVVIDQGLWAVSYTHLAADEYGVTAGFGLPIPRTRSVLSLSAQYVRTEAVSYTHLRGSYYSD